MAGPFRAAVGDLRAEEIGLRSSGDSCSGPEDFPEINIDFMTGFERGTMIESEGREDFQLLLQKAEFVFII